MTDDKTPTLSLLASVLRSEAWDIRRRLDNLAASEHVFDRNHEELSGLLTNALASDDNDPLWANEHPEAMIGVLEELPRLLSNFLYSAKMLVDQTRVFMREWYGGAALLEEYEREGEARFTGNTISGFVEDLRNYALHYHPPVAESRLTSTVDVQAGSLTRTRSIVLTRADLRQWSGWSTKGTTFLVASDDDIAILPLMNDYYERVRDFRAWLQCKTEQASAAELAWLRTMLGRIRQTPRGHELVKEVGGRTWLVMPRAPGGY